jgi:hypothetical protein
MSTSRKSRTLGINIQFCPGSLWTSILSLGIAYPILLQFSKLESNERIDHERKCK